MVVDDIILSLFPPVTTHLKHLKNDSFSHLFPFDGLVAVVAVTYSRYTVKAAGESWLSRVFWSILLGYLAFKRYDYWIQFSVQLFSFVKFFYERVFAYYAKGCAKSVENINKQTQVLTGVMTAYLVIFHIYYSIAYPEGEYSIFQSNLYKTISQTSAVTAPMDFAYAKIMETLEHLFPIGEFVEAHDILVEFIDPTELYAKAKHLLFVTMHIQVGMGFLGIAFLRAEQNRKNALVKIEDEMKKQKTKDELSSDTNNTAANENEDKNDVSKKFRRGAGPFIFFVAVPYMIQIVFYGAMNMYAFHCFRDDIHRTIRLNDLFEKDGSRFVATASSKGSNLSPGAYASNAETIVTTVYDLVNQSFFSLPKLMLLPTIVAKQPILMMKITPLIMFSDYVKASIVATINTEVERVGKQVKDIESRRTKVEQYDLKNSELIQRSGHESILFTERKWVDLTEQIQDLNARASIMRRCKMYFSWIQRHFVMMALVDCALAKLIAVGKIVAADIFVYARAIEDMINFVLMRSRADSELASMETSIKVLRELKDIWDASEDRSLLDCSFDDTTEELSIKGLTYTRGSASVQIENMSLVPGIYAVTGANGSGKSTLFRLIMGCNSNAESVDLHSSIVLNSPGSVQMPTSNVVEITQNFYFPLFSAPFDWIYGVDIFADVYSEAEKDEMTKKLEQELKSLNFYPETQIDNDTSTLVSDLTSSKDDWFSDLSGGQKSKVELVRKVFLADQCPQVLLIDETFAPLDPESKNLVMQKLKAFCNESIVLVIYHADVKVAEGEGSDENIACVESSNFFSSNIHVEDGSLFVRPVCIDDNDN